jgi:anaerobic selenocysteine-containing dehydrogenase
LTTVRSHDQFNTTIYGNNDRYRGIYSGRRVLFMHEEDMQAAGFDTQEKVNIINDQGGRTRIAQSFYVVPYQIPKGCVAAYFPEANVLVPIDSFDPASKVPSSKRIVVRVEKVS